MNRSSLDLLTGRTLLTASVLSLSITSIVRGQAVQLEDRSAALEEVVVTGTSIKGLNAETALPVQVVSREEIVRTGVTTTEELFRQISAASSSGSIGAASATGAQTGAISTISLRGLGSDRTLVLINGRRSAVYGGGSAGAAGSSVDISGIPLAAIERVEILKDGASAIYGSDAIAGVVNFILREDYQGATVSAFAGTPTTKGGGQQETVSAYGGLGDLKQDRYNVALGVNFEHDTALPGADRAFAQRYSPAFGNDVTSSFAFPANIAVPAKVLPGGKAATLNPNAGACGPNSLNDVNFPKQCRFDNSPFDSLEPEQTKISANFSGHLAVTDSSQLYTEASFAQVKTTTTVQPVPLSYQNPLLPGNPYIAYLANLLKTQYPNYKNPAVAPGNGAFLLPPTSPYYPTAFAAANNFGGQPLNLIYRDFANGQRETEDIANTFRAVGGLKGNAAGWDYDTALLFSEVQVHENLLSGFPLYSKIMPLLDQGNINPFGATTDPAQLAAAKGAEFVGEDFSSRTSLASLSGTASRALIDLPAGPLSAAVGAEVRRETFEYNPAVAIQTGDISGQGGNQLPEDVSRSVESTYLELNAPLAKGLDFDTAVRYDHYQHIGSTVNPKASLKWQPDSWVLVRASAGTGFRAPSLTDLYAGQASSVTGNGTRDPIQCPTFMANNPACSFQFTTTTGGNPNLTPEKSTTFTLGTVLEPIKNLTVDLDSYWIFLKNEIVAGGLSYATILENAQSATQFANLITRDAAGNITAISQTNANLFKVNTSGLDINVKYGFDVGAGRFSLLSSGTYIYKFASQNPDGSWTGEIDKGLNDVSVGGIISRWRHNATALYEMDAFNVSLTQNFQKRYHDVPGNINGVSRDVAAYQTFDMQGTYSVLKQLKVSLGVRNIFNQNPPYANYAASTNNFIGGYDVTYGDPLGRFVYARVTYTMH
jgi:iron complex outermembrane receptor protein